MLRAILLVLSTAGALGLKCNVYARTSLTKNAASTSTDCVTLDLCLTYSYSSTAASVTAGICGKSDTCETSKKTVESTPGFKDWTCDTCNTDDCNAVSSPPTGSASSGGRLVPSLLSGTIVLGLVFKLEF